MATWQEQLAETCTDSEYKALLSNIEKVNTMDEIDGLPQLTDKQYKYVEGKLAGLSNAEAYRQAYSSKTTKPESIWRRAAEVSSNSKVAAWLEYARREAVSKLVDETSYTLEEHIKELTSIQNMAMENGQYATALSAAVSKGKCTNKYVEHKDITVNNKADLAMIDKLELLLGHEAAMHAASNLGLAVPDKHLDS